MDHVIAAPPQPSLPVSGTPARFPVRRVYCVGRNYLSHIREFGNDEKALPFFFSKAPDMIVESGSTIPYPPLTQNFQHEEQQAAHKADTLHTSTQARLPQQLLALQQAAVLVARP